MSTPAWNFQPPPHGDQRPPNSDDTSPYTGHCQGGVPPSAGPFATSVVRSVTDSFIAAVCPSSHASCSSACAVGSETSAAPVSGTETGRIGDVSGSPLSSSRASRRRVAAPSRASDVTRAARSIRRCKLGDFEALPARHVAPLCQRSWVQAQLLTERMQLTSARCRS